MQYHADGDGRVRQSQADGFLNDIKNSPAQLCASITAGTASSVSRVSTDVEIFELTIHFTNQNSGESSDAKRQGNEYDEIANSLRPNSRWSPRSPTQRESNNNTCQPMQRHIIRSDE